MALILVVVVVIVVVLSFRIVYTMRLEGTITTTTTSP